MPLPLNKTFDFLGGTANLAAVELMIAGLDVPDEGVQHLAVAAILKRCPIRGIVEIIRRSDILSRPARELVDKNAPLFSRGLRDSLLSPDAALRTRALDLIRQFEDFSEFPALIRLLEQQSVRDREGVEAVIFDLINRLYEHLQFGRDHEEPGGFLRDSERVRHQVLSVLEGTCHRFSIHRSRRVVEGLLILSDSENIYLKKLFQESSDEVRGIAADLFQSSRHPGIPALALSVMGQNYPLPAAFAAFERRTDPEFICHVLRHWPRQLTPIQQKNFSELRSVAWLEPDELHLDLIPAALHPAAVAFLMATGLSQPQKLAVLEWMVRFGSAEGRMAATEVLMEIDDDRVQDVVLEGLESKEPDVQAWATSQLRAWSIPNAMELLIERVDSPLPEVREAARRELGGFDIYRALEIFGHLDPQMQLAVGNLVQKIDPETPHKLRNEILHAIRSKRIRAARAAVAMNLQFELADAFLSMARDPDNHVRRTATEVLGTIRSREAVELLLDLTNDPSPRVRDAATIAVSSLQASRGAAASAAENAAAKTVSAGEARQR